MTHVEGAFDVGGQVHGLQLPEYMFWGVEHEDKWFLVHQQRLNGPYV